MTVTVGEKSQAFSGGDWREDLIVDEEFKTLMEFFSVRPWYKIINKDRPDIYYYWIYTDAHFI